MQYVKEPKEKWRDHILKIKSCGMSPSELNGGWERLKVEKYNKPTTII